MPTRFHPQGAYAFVRPSEYPANQWAQLLLQNEPGIYVAHLHLYQINSEQNACEQPGLYWIEASAE